MAVFSKIAGVGCFLPDNIVTNDDLSKLMETNDEWIQQRTGIKERRWVTGKTNTSDLALQACERALKNANIKKEEIDLIILGTLSPDHQFPGTGIFLQTKLGLKNIPCLDIRQQCSAFIYGLKTADAFIRSEMYKNILLVGAEVHSKGLDRTTRGRDVAVLFGDGAGAVVVAATDGKEGKIISTVCHADGEHADQLWLQAPGMSYEDDWMPKDAYERGDHYPKMNGKLVFVNAVTKMPEVIHEVLGDSKMAISDVDFFVFHQANARINEKIAKMLNIPEEKILNTIHKYANTTAATIPIGLNEAVEAGKIKPGMVVCMCAFGSGFTWGASLVRW